MDGLISNHLRSFRADKSSLSPQINVISNDDFRAINSETIIRYPGPFLTVLSLLVCFSLVQYMLPKKEHKPLLAIPDIFKKDIRQALVNRSGWVQAMKIYRDDSLPVMTKIWRTFLVYMKDYHTILSVFASNEHTNFSNRQRVACCFMYLITIIAISALFYGRRGEVTDLQTWMIMFWGGLMSCLPVYAIIYAFQFTRPKDRQLSVKTEGTFLVCFVSPR